MKRKKKQSGSKFKIILVVIALYLGSYAVNSLMGGYWMRPERRAAAGAAEEIVWQPRIGFVSRSATDAAGYAFWPLVQLDRRFVHLSRDLGDDKTFEWADSLPLAQVHPALREEVRKGRREASKSDEL